MPPGRHPDRISTAMVMANGLATVYRRWGSGRTVLLLGASEAVALALGDWFRVIVPQEAPERVKGVIIPDSPAPDAAVLRAALERIFS